MNLTPAEVKLLRTLVLELHTIINYDHEGITADVWDLAESAAEILGLEKIEIVEDEEEQE